MAKKYSVYTALAALVLLALAVYLLGYGRLDRSRSGEIDRSVISTLKSFNSMTTYGSVVKIMGKPAARGEWAVDGGKVRIAFSNNRVTRINYTDRSGETVYSYKKLVD